MMKFTIHPNGSFDLFAGGISFQDCFPGVNGRPLRPERVKAEKDSVRYEWTGGALTLRFAQKADELTIFPALSDAEKLTWLEPVCGAVLGGARRLNTQGFGIGGPTRLVELAETEAESSHGLGVFGDTGDWTAVFTEDHRKYLFRIAVRAGDKNAYGDAEKTVSFGFRTELANAPEETLPAITLLEFPALEDGKQRCARRIAAEMDARHAQPPAFHWCSWYYQYQHLTQPVLEEYVKGFAQYQVPFRYVQVDWGYCPSPGDWLLPGERFPEGMKKAGETMLAAGYTPGIWIAPFMVGSESRLAAEHPDWLLHRQDGGLVVMQRQVHENRMWGLRDRWLYALDTSHPDAMAYIRRVFRTYREWGYRLYKTDFMLWGYHDSTQVKRYTPGKTGAAYFREALQAIREEIGEDSYWLGCIAPFYSFIGYADAMRIGGDVGAQWVEHDLGPVNMIQEIFGDSYLNGSYWQNDPDVVILRDFDIDLKPQEVESLALLQAMSGGVVAVSDPIHKISEERRQLLRFIQPDGEFHPATLPEAEKLLPLRVMVQNLPQGKLLYFFNPTMQQQNQLVAPAALLGGSYFLREYGGENCGSSEKLFVSVAPHGGKLYFAADHPLSAQPANLWQWEE